MKYILSEEELKELCKNSQCEGDYEFEIAAFLSDKTPVEEIATGELRSEPIKIKEKDNSIAYSSALWVDDSFLNALIEPKGYLGKNIKIYIQEVGK